MEKIEPLLPPQKPWTGRPSHEHRTLLNGILWILRTGAPWRDLPERYGKWTTVYSRFQRWRKKEVWQRVLSELQSLADQQGQLDWGVQFEDGTDCACPSTCCRGKKSTPEAEALGRSRGGLTTKIHVRAEGNGKLLTFLLTPGQQHDITVAENLLEQGEVRRKGGQRRRLPKRLVADKGYSSRKFRTYLRKHRIRLHHSS